MLGAKMPTPSDLRRNNTAGLKLCKMVDNPEFVFLNPKKFHDIIIWAMTQYLQTKKTKLLFLKILKINKNKAKKKTFTAPKNGCGLGG